MTGQFKVSLAEAFEGDSQVSVVDTDVLHQFIESKVSPQYARVACKEKLFAGTGDSYVQFAVYPCVAFPERIGGKEIQLVKVAYGKRINDDIALASLIAFYGIDGNIH